MTDISVGCAQAGPQAAGSAPEAREGGPGGRGRTRLLTLACSICCSAAARVFWSADMQFISSGVTSMAPASRGLTNTRESCQGEHRVGERSAARSGGCVVRSALLHAGGPAHRHHAGRPAVHPPTRDWDKERRLVESALTRPMCLSARSRVLFLADKAVFLSSPLAPSPFVPSPVPSAAAVGTSLSLSLSLSRNDRKCCQVWQSKTQLAASRYSVQVLQRRDCCCVFEHKGIRILVFA